MKTSRSRTTRRKILQASASSLLVPMALVSGKAPAQGGKKPFEGVTLNISCWSSTYPTLLAQYPAHPPIAVVTAMGHHYLLHLCPHFHLFPTRFALLPMTQRSPDEWRAPSRARAGGAGRATSARR